MAILDFRMILSILIYKSPRYFLPSFASIGLSVQEKKRKIGFQDLCSDGHLGFPIGTILAIFDLQVAPTLLIKFRVLAFRFRRRKAKQTLKMAPMAAILDFQSEWVWLLLSTWHPDTSYQVSSQLAQGCMRGSLLKQIVDAARRTTDDAQRTLTNHNSSPSTSSSGELIILIYRVCGVIPRPYTTRCIPI